MKHVTPFLYSIIIIIGLWLRFWYLGVVPAAFYHDELDYVVTGQSLIRWGTDLSGKWNPLQLRPLQTINMTAELPAVFHAVTQFVVGSTPAAARLTNAFFGLATVILIGFLANNLSGKTNVGIWVSLIMLVNPWHIHISRLGYEATISLFFQLLLIYSLVHLLPLTAKPNRQKLWLPLTMMSLFFSYYTYHGAKFTTIAIIITYFCWHIRAATQERKRLILLGLVTFLQIIMIIHTLWLNQHGLLGWRSQQDVYTVESAATVVDQQRRDRIPFVTDKWVVNKYSVAANELLNRYWFTFDPNRLFMTGYEGTHQFSLVVAGYFGVIELVGIILYIRYGRYLSHRVLVTLLAVSPIATVLAGYQAILRSALTNALLLLFAGYGIAWVIRKFRLAKYIVVLIMCGSSIWFGIQYFARYPLVTAENHMLSERLLARYTKSVDEPIMIVVDLNSYITARSIIYYNQWFSLLQPEERLQFNYPFPATISVNNVTVTTECPTSLPTSPLAITLSKWRTCGLEQQYQQLTEKSLTSLSSPLDNGGYYLLWNDDVCNNEGKDFIHLTDLSQLNIENLTDHQFCQTWVKKEI